MWCPIDWVTEDGFDMQWGTNVVGTKRFATHVVHID
jgi:hypothetical protein